MKRILLPLTVAGLVAFAAVGIGSCNRNGLDEPLSGNTEEVLDNPLAMTKGVMGIYSKMNELYNPASFSAAVDVVSLHAVYYLMGDDITTTNIANFEHFGGINANDPAVAFLYKQLYIMNARANFILDVIAQKPEIYASEPATKNTHQGEALFLRGYTHYLLWNYFGRAPVVNKRFNNISETFEVKNSSGTELLDAAIADFTQAATLLPTAYAANYAGRVTQNAANAFLGKALVFKATVTKDAGTYANALTALKKVTTTLLPAVMNNFSFRHENSVESLFEFQATRSAEDNIWISNDVYGTGAACTTWNFYELEAGVSGWIFNGEQGRFRPTQKLVALFEAGDPRATQFIDNSTPTAPRFRKYVTENFLIPGREGSSINNPRIMRHADVVLLKAEAALGSNGSLPEAIGYINEVRTRARGAGTAPANRSTAETNRTLIMQWIMDERMRELCGEDNQRWFDLRRWHLGQQLTLNAAYFNSIDAPANSFQAPKNLYFPIPNTEILVNKNLTQNGGY